MKQDLETVRGHRKRQPADVRQLLAPTRDKRLEFVNAILEIPSRPRRRSRARRARRARDGARDEGRGPARQGG
jgi:hypothetical protein